MEGIYSIGVLILIILEYIYILLNDGTPIKKETVLILIILEYIYIFFSHLLFRQ